MRKIREVLRLKHERGLSHRAIAQACAIGVGTVTLYLKRTAQQGFGWPLPAELDDAALEARCSRSPKYPVPTIQLPRRRIFFRRSRWRRFIIRAFRTGKLGRRSRRSGRRPLLSR